MVVPYAPAGATLPGGFTLERRKIRGVVSRRHAVLGRRSSGSATTTAASSTSTPAPSSAPTCASVLGLDDVIFDLAITPEPARRDVHRRRRPRARRALRARLHGARAASRSPTRRSPNDITVRGRGRRRGARATSAGSRAVTMGAVAGVDGAAPGEGGHAADQQRGRRHQLRAARAQPAAARVRPRPPARAAASSCGSPTTARRMTTLDGVERALTHEDLLICDAERRAAGHRRDHGRRRRPRCRTPPPRSCSSRRTSSAMGIARIVQAARSCAASRARGSSAASTPTRSRATPNGRWSCSVEVAGAQVAADASTCTRAPVDAAAHPRARPAGSTRCSAPTSTPKTCGTRSAPLGIELDGDPADGADDVVAVASRRSAPTSTARSTSSRRSPAASASTASAARCPTPTVRSAGSPSASSERRLVADALVGRRAVRGDHRCRWSRPPTSSAPARRSTGWSRATNPLRAEESVLRTAVLPGLLRAVARQPRPGPRRRRAVRAGPRVPRAPLGAGRRSAPRRARARRARAGGHRAPPPGRGRPPGRRLRRGRRGRARCVDALESPTSTSGAGDAARLRARRAAARRGRRPRRPARGRGRARGARRARARRRRWSRPSSTSTRCSTPPAATARSARRRASRRRASTSRSSLDDARARRRRRARRCGPRSATCSRTCALFDVFRSDALGAGRRSLAFALRFRAPDRTLTDAEVGALRQRAIDAVIAAHGGRAARVTPSVRPPRPAPLRRGRRAGRGVQRPLAHLLRRGLDPVLRVARLRARGRVLPGVRRDGREGGRSSGRARPGSTTTSRSRWRRAGSAPSRSTSSTRRRWRAVRRAPAPSPTCR